MIYYRLLRDNKETGPYSEEEMIAKGFKPYDLLWAEGKSAGWQYPSEVPAFKPHAPIVEEQPYDRFYKRQPTERSSVTEDRYTSRSATPLPSKNNDSNEQQLPARPSYNYNAQALPGKHIHVTLPSGNTINLTTLVAKKEVNEPKENAAAPEKSKPSVNANALTAANAYTKPVADNSTVEKEPFLFNQNISTAQYPAINEFSAQAPAQEKSFVPAANGLNAQQASYQSSRSDFSWTLVLGAVIGIATMVGLGIMIGLSINRDKNNAALTEALNNQTKQAAAAYVIKPASNTVTAAPQTATYEEPVVNIPQHEATPAKNKELVQNAVVKTAIAPENNSVKEDKKTETADKTPSDKIKVIQSAEETAHPKPLVAVNLSLIEKSLTITENNFKTGAFGGISHLSCTLYNGSKSSLESVVAEIDYIQANDKVYKTEKIVFKDIAAGTQVTVDAPASSRGVKVVSRVIKVNPKEALSNTTAKS